MHSTFLHIQLFFLLFNVWRKSKNFDIFSIEELIDSLQTFEMNLNQGFENHKEQYFENVSWVDFSINYGSTLSRKCVGFSLIIIFKILSLVLGPLMSSSSRRRQQACEACKIIDGGGGWLYLHFGGIKWSLLNYWWLEGYFFPLSSSL